MPTQVINILSNGTSAAAFDMESAVIWNLRIPRILLNILVGGALAIAGTVFQGIFRNPLVSPDILGVSSGAAFGAALGILISGINIYATGFALIFGIASVCLTYSLARLRNQITSLSLVLSGMIVSAIFGALIALIKYIADPYDKLPAITYWLMGSFSTASYENVSLVSIPIIPLDTHVHQISLRLGLTGQKTATLRTAREITDALAKVFPDDPCLGDFALFGYDINQE